MKTVVLVTGHYLGSHRRAGFHWLADAYRADGWRVVFLTAGVSWLLWLRRIDHRLRYPLVRERNRIVWKAPDLASFVWLTPWHPSRVPWPSGDRLAAPLFRRYASLPLGDVEELVRQARLIVYDSTPGLMLADRFRRIAPGARHVYRVSDDMRTLAYHPVVEEAEGRIAAVVDLVSVPSRALADRFAGLPHLTIQPHGIARSLFDRDCSSPYIGAADFNALFVGAGHLDYDVLQTAARAFPAGTFHVIGPFDPRSQLSNIRWYGELPFEATVPYIRHADIGLQLLTYREGAESFTDSLKVLQYTYCRLPIVAPEFLRNPRSNFTYYSPESSASIAAAVGAALRMEHSLVSRTGLRDWSDLARDLAGEGVPDDVVDGTIRGGVV